MFGPQVLSQKWAKLSTCRRCSYILSVTSLSLSFENTVKLGFKERLDKEQIGNSEPFPLTNLLVYLINSEQIGISEQFCNDQKVPYYQV